MAPIPGWTYVLVGAVISAFSKFVEAKSNTNMTLFFYAGILFLIIGAGKIAVNIFSEKKHHANRLYNQLQTSHNTAQHKMHSQHTTQTNINQQQTQRSNHQQNPRIISTHPINNPTQNNRRLHIQTENTKSSKTADHPSIQNIISCPACGVRHYSYANFCMICGYRLKK